MTRIELQRLVDGIPSDMTLRSGSVLLSPLSAFRPGPALLLGLNPGGDPAKIPTSLRDRDPPDDGMSPYTHELWRDGRPAHVPSSGEALAETYLVPHQRRIVALARLLGYPGPDAMPSANLIFARSSSLAQLRSQTGHDARTWAQACWPVHRALLGVVRPKLIVSLGYGAITSPIGLLPRWKLINVHARHEILDGPRRWGQVVECTVGTTTGDLPTTVVGIPHPSWHSMPSCIADALAAVMQGAPSASQPASQVR